MAHVNEAVYAPAEDALGKPVILTVRYPISADEMAMVVSSTRGQTRLHDVTLFIFNEEGQLALIRKHGYPPGAWRAPGGGVDPGEPFLDGAAREAFEETGLRVVPDRYLLRVYVTFTCEGTEQPWTTHVVTAKTSDGAPAIHDPKEIAGVKFGSLTELTGPIAKVLRGTGRGLFAYRADLHDEVAKLLG